MEPLNIYLAGKIGKNDWRHGIVGELRGIFENEAFDVTAPPDWPVLEGAIFGKHNYVGPYFIGCDHGCFHGSNSHGAGAWGLDYCFGEVDKSKSRETQGFITQACSWAIEKADLIFAWIDDLTAFGTFAELGFAAALKKHIFIAGTQRFPDLWFLYELGYQNCRFETGLTPSRALEFFLAGAESAEKGFFIDEQLSPIEKRFMNSWAEALLKTFPMDRKLILDPQHEVMGGKYRLDFAHLETKTTIELDGLEAHRTTDQIANDRRRQRELEAVGWRFIRFGGKEVYHDVDKCVEETRQFILKAMNQE